MKKWIAPVCMPEVHHNHLGVWWVSKEECTFQPCEELAKPAAEVANPPEPEKKAKGAKPAEPKPATQIIRPMRRHLESIESILFNKRKGERKFWGNDF